MWLLTVASLMTSRPAISAFDSPSAMRVSTSVSRGVRPSGSAGVAFRAGGGRGGDRVDQVVLDRRVDGGLAARHPRAARWPISVGTGVLGQVAAGPRPQCGDDRRSSA